MPSTLVEEASDAFVASLTSPAAEQLTAKAEVDRLGEAPDLARMAEMAPPDVLASLIGLNECAESAADRMFALTGVGPRTVRGRRFRVSWPSFTCA